MRLWKARERPACPSKILACTLLALQAPAPQEGRDLDTPTSTHHRLRGCTTHATAALRLCDTAAGAAHRGGGSGAGAAHATLIAQGTDVMLHCTEACVCVCVFVCVFVCDCV